MSFKRRKRHVLTDEEIDEKFKDVEFEKNDVRAMVIAALITFIPVVLLVGALIYGLIWILFLR